MGSRSRDRLSARGEEEREALRRQRDEAERRAATLSRVIELISGERQLAPLLTRIVESAVELIGAPSGSIGLVKETASGPVVQTAAGVNIPPREQGTRYPPGVGLSGSVLRAQCAIRLDRYRDLQQPVLHELAEYAALGIPIWWAERVIGVFNIGAPPPRRFSEQDVETLTVFARHAAIAIENARLFEAERRRAARFAIINRIGRLMISSLRFDELLQIAVEAMCESFDFAYLAAAIADPEDPAALTLLAQAGAYAANLPIGHRYSLHRGLIGVAARTRQRVLVNDVARDPRYVPIPGATAICAELVVPIAVGDRFLGIINIESERRIDEEEAEAIEIIADQFGAVLENARLFGDLQSALATTQLLYETSQRMSTAMSVTDVVAAYLEQVAAGGRYLCSVRLDEIDERGQRTAAIVHGRWIPGQGMDLVERRLPYILAEFDAVLDAGQVVTVRDFRTDPRVGRELRELQESGGRLAFAIIPLIVRGRRIGRVNLSSLQVHDWVEAELRPYQVTAALLAAAIDSRQQYLLLSERGQQLAVLEERRRLARELHDSVTQSLVSMSLLAQTVPELWEIDREGARRSLTQIRELTRGALAEMRALLFELRPADESEQNLARALEHHAAAFERRTGVAATVHVEAISLPDTVAYALSRIAQEALANVARHAQARHVSVDLNGGRPLCLRIVDDGRGFDPDRVGPGHLGLISMRERAASIEAGLRVWSTPGQGTRVVVEWPSPSARPT